MEWEGMGPGDIKHTLNTNQRPLIGNLRWEDLFHSHLIFRSMSNIFNIFSRTLSYSKLNKVDRK